MLWWVLLCDYCIFFLYVPKTSEICWAINARQILDTSYRCHCLLFKVLNLIRIVLCLYQNHPRGRYSCLHQHTVSVTVLHDFELHSMSMGYACLICTQFIFTHLMEGRVLQVPFSLQRVTLDNPTISLSYNNTLSRIKINGFWLYVCS